MADWTGMARTNYFRVKDDRAFDKLLEEFGAEHQRRGDQYVLLDQGVGWFSSLRVTTDPVTGDVTEDEDADLLEAVAEHLLEGEILVYMQAGHEESRYASGLALATDGKKWLKIELADIYAKAKEVFGKMPEPAEY